AADLSTMHALTELGSTVGTVAYMSPEQVRGEPLDARTDVFSFGLVLYEAATGQRAFSGSTPGVISEAILNCPPVAIGRLNAVVHPVVEAVIAKAIEKDPRLRYQSIADLKAALERIKRGSAPDIPARVDAPRPRRMSGRQAAAALVAIVVLAAGSWF